jgi:hypothetical protein
MRRAITKTPLAASSIPAASQTVIVSAAVHRTAKIGTTSLARTPRCEERCALVAPNTPAVIFRGAAIALGAAAVTAVALLAWIPRWLAPSDATIVTSTPSVVVAVRELARLESAQAHIERVIELRDKQSALFGLISVQDAILLVAVGEVMAGVDLSGVRDDDIVADRAHGSVRLMLPAPEVLTVRLDNERTWIYSRATDLLAQRHEDLETRARREAERTLEQTAIDSGLIETARVNAERTLESLLHSLGYTSVTIGWREALP